MASLIFPTAQVVIDVNAIYNNGNWSTFEVHLTQEQFALSPIPDLAALLAAESTFNGYSPQLVSGLQVFTFNSGIFAPLTLGWASGSPATPQNIYNFFITDDTGSILLAFGTLSDNIEQIMLTTDLFQVSFAMGPSAGLTDVFPSF